MFCQSCTMPIDEVSNRGTEKDGSLSIEYCKYCYASGKLIDPEMSIEKMQTVITEQMKRKNIPENIIQKSIEMLPHLKRWQKEAV